MFNSSHNHCPQNIFEKSGCEVEEMSSILTGSHRPVTTTETKSPDFPWIALGRRRSSKSTSRSTVSLRTSRPSMLPSASPILTTYVRWLATTTNRGFLRLVTRRVMDASWMSPAVCLLGVISSTFPHRFLGTESCTRQETFSDCHAIALL